MNRGWVVRQLTEFLMLVEEFDGLQSPDLWLLSSWGQRKNNRARCSSVFEELRAREPTVHAILKAAGYEPVTISDDVGSALDPCMDMMSQSRRAIGAYKALDQGREQLAGYLNLLERHPLAFQAGLADRDSETLAELRRREAAVKEILQQLDPKLADFDIDHPDGRKTAHDAVNTTLKIVSNLTQLDWRMATRSSDGPVMAVDQLHPWVWDAVQGLCKSGYYQQAVQAAATAVSAHTQAKLGRSDVTDTTLMREAFSKDEPGPGKPRLRCPGDPASQTVRSRQDGALQYASGCYLAIRNPASHEHGEWDPQVTLEYLTALSVLARWIDEWTVVTAP